jgi:hypothetical protein
MGVMNQTNLQIRKNGEGFGIVQTPVTSIVENTQTITKLVQLNGSTDYVDITVFTGNTTSQAIQGGVGTWFSAALQ